MATAGIDTSLFKAHITLKSVITHECEDNSKRNMLQEVFDYSLS